MRDALQDFVRLSQSLQTERAAILVRLAELDRALGSGAQASVAGGEIPIPFALAPKRRGRPPGSGRRGRGGRRATAPDGSKLGMREAITQATAQGAMIIRDLVPAMQKLGYKFSSKNPVNSVGAYLYGPTGKKYFKKRDGGFVAK